MRTLLCTSLLFAFLSAAAHGGTLSFIQGGWDVGGPLTTSFDASDVNLDGLIEVTELTRFEAKYYFADGGFTVWGLTDIQPGGFLFSSNSDYLVFAANQFYTLVTQQFSGFAVASIADEFLFSDRCNDRSSETCARTRDVRLRRGGNAFDVS